MLSALLGLIAPPRCALCELGCDSRERLCGRCAATLAGAGPRLSFVPGLDAAWSAASYEGVARQLVVRLKFGGRLPLAGCAARLIAERAPAELLVGVIVPVPPAPIRRRWRGFDPAEAIATALASQAGLPIDRCLSRSQGSRQVGRPRADRLANPPRVSLVGQSPEHALLVDDVVTTGATLGACARALRAGGSGRVVAVTFARSEALGAGAQAA